MIKNIKKLKIWRCYLFLLIYNCVERLESKIRNFDNHEAHKNHECFSFTVKQKMNVFKKNGRLNVQYSLLKVMSSAYRP